MILNIGKMQFKLSFYVKKQAQREGVCSAIFGKDDAHILLWDFDNASLSELSATLLRLSLKYSLPSIRIIESSASKYHAYCFTSRPFREVMHILSDTPEIDDMYLRIGAIRGYYTLRISPRRGESFKLVKIISSVCPDEVSPLDVTVNKFLTMNKGGK